MAGERLQQQRRLERSSDGSPCCVDYSLKVIREWGSPVYHKHTKGHTWCRYCWPPKGRGRGEARTSPRRLYAHVLRYQAMELRLEQYRRDHLSYAEIAKACGRSKTWAYYACNPHKRRKLAWQ
jgi:hypothetical protein